jgi:hypothetical protein
MTEKTPEPANAEAGKPKAATVRRGLPPADAADRPDAARPARKRDVVPVLYLVGFVVLAAAIVWLWQNPPVVPPPSPSPEVEQLRQQVNTLESQLARLEQRPTAVTPPAADLAPLAARVAALEARKPPPPVDLAPLEAAVASLEKRPAGDPAIPARVDALAGRVDALTGRMEAMEATSARRLDGIEARLAPLEKSSGQITALADRSARIARIQAAQSALDSGVKLGDLPGAPAALARYATAAPPTEASLRLSFPAAADAALAASRPVVDDKPFLDRAWAKAQDLVTLRQGDHVILGDPAAGILARARAALNAGDLTGAVSALSALSGPAAAAIAEWKAQAQGLLDARKALADMAAHA